MLKDHVYVSRNYQRSMRLDRDVHTNDALAGYVAQASTRRTLVTMAVHINGGRQTSFTWTGPYGCGKSSLALLLCELVGTREQHDRAARLLHLRPDEPLAKAFAQEKGWDVLIVVGRQGNLTKDLAHMLGTKRDGRAVVAKLVERAQKQKAPDAFLLIIDELGKYLESEDASENAYLLQEIAEAASRASAKFVFLGILHQAVDVYASRLPRSVRDEWAKVQGRFVDIPLLTTLEETVELLSRAIEHRDVSINDDPRFVEAVTKVAHAFEANRPASKNKMMKPLLRCWPLHPVTTLLLGPVSRRKFSQNERSIYSFLSAQEPNGFQSFLQMHKFGEHFLPDRYWDYLKENFENSILTTSDAHRWLTALEAISRAERSGDAVLVKLAKTVALIDLFRTGSGIQASRDVLAASILLSETEVERHLKKLVNLRVIIERRYAHAFSIFAGSDFDIESALKEAQAKLTSLDTSIVESFMKLQPVVAREYYFRMGTLRWFDRRVVCASDIASFDPVKTKTDGASGAFVLVIPDHSDESLDKTHLEEMLNACELTRLEGYIPVIGVSPFAEEVRQRLEELQLLRIVEKSPELEGDETGRQEVQTRISFALEAFSEALAKAYTTATWMHQSGKQRYCGSTLELSNYAGSICDAVYSKAPPINNELINRDYLSTQVSAARKELMMRMVSHTTEPKLGFTDYPPAYALYLSILKDMHIDTGDGYAFVHVPPSSESENDDYGPLWEDTREFLKTHPMVSGKELFDFWSKPPFGLKRGPMPILALVFYLMHQENIGVYLADVFQSTVDEVTVDEWLVDPKRIAFRWVDYGTEYKDFLHRLASLLHEQTGEPVEETPLSIGRMLVGTIFNSPRWSQRSTSFTPETLALKNILAKASDPLRLLYKDAPTIYGERVGVKLADRIFASLREFVAAMPNMLDKVRDHLFRSIGADPKDLVSIRERAKNIKGLSGSMALEAFIARLERFENSNADIEGIISLATSRPSQMWTDREVLAALSKISEFGMEFRKQESFAALRGRREERRVFSLNFANPDDDLQETIEIDEKEAEQVKDVVARLQKILGEMPKNIALAALSDAGVALVRKSKES